MGDDLSQDDLDGLMRQAQFTHQEADSSYSLRIEERKGCLFLVISGRIITPVIPNQFTEAFSRLMEGKATKGVVIDLGDCDYLSSGAMGFILQFFQAATKRGLQVVMLRPKERIRKVIEILGMLNYFLLVEDEDMAVRFYQEQLKQFGERVRTPMP